MKYLLTLILLTSFFTIASSQEILRLDSIVYEDLDTGEFYPLEFTYDEEDRLSTLIGLEEGDIDFEFTYNENGDFSNWKYSDGDGNIINYGFVYNMENELDSVNGFYQSYGYDVNIYIDVTSENGQIQDVKTTEDYGGYPFVYFDKEFRYNAESKLDSILYYDVFYYSGDVTEIYEFDYLDDKLIERLYTDLLYPSEGFKDSLGFDDNNLTQTHSVVYNDLDTENSYITTYMDSAPFLDEEFIGPYDFFYSAYMVFDNLYSEEFFTLMNNDRPTSHVTNTDFSLFRGTWYYTIFVNNTLTEITAQPMSIQPNPATDYVQINLDEEITKIEIYSMAGEMLLSDNSTEKLINIERLSAGSYVLIATSKQGANYFSKLVKN